MNWICKSFQTLKPEELYAILQLRNEVFVVEQNCVFQDADGKDEYAWHMMCWNDDRLIAYTRLLPKGISYTNASIGRVVTSHNARRSGIGKELMYRSIAFIYDTWGKQAIQIGAQLYLKKFYEHFGFQQTSEIYLEDGIDHIEMIVGIQ